MQSDMRFHFLVIFGVRGLGKFDKIPGTAGVGGKRCCCELIVSLHSFETY